MNLAKKAISAATSAALLASLLATAVAPSAFAAGITVGSAGNVPVGGTSANNVSFTFGEQSVNSIVSNGSGSFIVTITPAAPGLGSVSFVGTPSTAGSTGSLGASASLIAPNMLKVSILGSDPTQLETIFITGLKISAALGTSTGAIVATLSGWTGTLTGAGQFAVGGTATGTIATGIGAGATSVVVNVTSGTCLFSSGGTLAFATSPESVALTTASALNTPAIGQQTLTIGATGSIHNATEVVSETTGCAVSNSLASPGTVVAAASYSSGANLTIFPGENNEIASPLYVTEPSGGFFVAGTTLTFTIATTGVVFSNPPTLGFNAVIGGAALPGATGTLSLDRTAYTVTIGTADATSGTVTVSNILYDVAANVPGGTFVTVNLAISGGLAVLPTSNTNAIVFRGITASAASIPTVYIGENNQPTGLVTLVESGPGFFNAGPGPNNTIAVCERGANYTYTTAPYAKVVGGTAAGNLILRDGANASATNIVAGTWNGAGCYSWTVWTASTVASSIVIGNSTFTSGPLINVASDQAQGTVAMGIYAGNGDTYTQYRIATVAFANAMFRNQVAVTALAQPTIPLGAKTKVGAIQVAETGIGQLKAYESVCFEVLPRSSTGFLKQDILIQALTTADLPTATATGGLIVGPVQLSNSYCDGSQPVVGTSSIFNLLFGSFTHTVSFSFPVLQQSTTGTGKLVVDNINLITTADAPNGPVLFNVYGFGNNSYQKGGTDLQFQATVSNAKVGTAPSVKFTVGTALGATKNATFTTSTKVVKLSATNKYVTWRFSAPKALAGKVVVISVLTKLADGTWGAPKALTTRLIDINGNAYFWWKSTTATWVAVSATYAGDDNYAMSVSASPQARWMK